MQHEKDIEFVVTHYREGRFNAEQALRRIKPVGVIWWKRTRVAAAMAALIVVSATAAILINNNFFSDNPHTTEEVQTQSKPSDAIMAIDFEETPLPVVVAKISDVYGVEITGVPENAETYILSLHYEGNAADLVETINDILGTEMKIVE